MTIVRLPSTLAVNGRRSTSLFRLILPVVAFAAACGNRGGAAYSATTSGIVPVVDAPAWTARLGGTGVDQINAVAIDSAGNVIVGGQTSTTIPRRACTHVRPDARWRPS